MTRAAAGRDSSSPYGLASVAARRAPHRWVTFDSAQPPKGGSVFKRRQGVRFRAALTTPAPTRRLSRTAPEPKVLKGIAHLARSPH
jgi:hypothetical protein